MMRLRAGRCASLVIMYCALVSLARADDPLAAQSRAVQSASAPSFTQQTFTIDTATDLLLTVTDLQIPAALSSANVAVTQGDKLVGSATIAAPATTASIALAGAVGDYTVYVFGAPGSSVSVGTFSACVAPSSNPSNCIQSASFAGNITAASSAQDPTLSTLSVGLTVTTAGSYTFALSDLQFPVALVTAPNLALFQGSVPVQLGIAAGSSVTLAAGNYTLLGIAQADAGAKAGLYGLTIQGPAGTPPLFDRTLKVGLANPAATTNNETAQQVTLKVTDYGFPAPLASASALVTAGGSSLGRANAASGSASFQAPAGALQVWTYAGASGSPGTYSVDLSGGTYLYSAAQGLQVDGAATLAYAFATQAVDAGAYVASAADLNFPGQLAAMSFAVAQNGVILQQSTQAGSLNVSAAAGPIVFLVSAQPPSSSSGSVSGGLFDVNLQSMGASASLLFDKTQIVSATPTLFDSRTLTLGVNSSFDAILSDLKFPEAFSNLALVVSQGSDVLGKTYGGGTFRFVGAPGQYQLTFVASPATDQQYGLYGIHVAFTPPTISLNSDVMSQTAGGIVNLTWSATNASSCTASGGNWIGPKSTTQTSEGVTLQGDTTYTLTCTGAGGDASQSVTVTQSAAPTSSHHGGGGTLDLWTLVVGGGLVAARNRARRRVA